MAFSRTLAAVAAPPADRGTGARASIEGSSRDLLALLLGRPAPGLRHGGDVECGHRFAAAFPGP